MIILNENDIYQVRAGIGFDAIDTSGMEILGILGMVVSIPIFITMLYAAYPVIPANFLNSCTVGWIMIATGIGIGLKLGSLL